MDEYIDVLRELWSPAGDPEKSTVAGRFVDVRRLHHAAPPGERDRADRDRGHSRRRRPTRRSRGDGFFPGGGTMEELAELFAIVRAEAEAAAGSRRHRALQRRWATGPKLDARIEQLAEIGVTHVVLPAAPADELPGIGADLLSRFG